MLKSNPYAIHIIKNGHGCCESISPLILCQIKQISVKKLSLPQRERYSFCSVYSTIYFSFRIPYSLLNIHFPTQADFIHSG